MSAAEPYAAPPTDPQARDIRTASLAMNEDLHAALVLGREAVDEFVTASLLITGKWAEETVTDILYTRAAPRLRPVPFNRNQEGLIGADWLWWWVEESTGICFGMLCQAKNLKRTGTTWSIGYGQSNRTWGAQLPNLLAAADYFEVPAVYMLYCGDAAYRRGLSCGGDACDADDPDASSPCPDCPRMGVSVLSGLAAAYLYGRDPRAAAADSFRYATPLEDLADPGVWQQRWDINFRSCGLELQKFLLTPQYGAALAAKRIFMQLSSIREMHFAAAAPAPVVPRFDDDLPRAVFPPSSVPQDKGHFSVPYFLHVLRGLRTAPPPYVQAALEGGSDAVPRPVADQLAGLVVIQV
ncbi:hypothetical protein AQJ54_39940 [Streptomyces griseorubiginosus]|uniref:Uncharacterized protein n=2 Tax=Streptomyces griseorubiginosus TaxID=67304 RepID=A0A101RPB6_9ACTN|nr:hypothetical protein AQJ54_39940 [Streptomyces griseorubiginosus]